MNWIEGISEAIEYIEANLTNDLKIEDIAAKAYASPYYFQKSFSLLCGFTVGEYIRNRRLASAGNDLLSCEEKVIDIALKYGFDSVDSFTKAFTRFHGATPTAVRKSGHPIKLYAPLKLELFVKGGYIMDYRIQKQESFLTKVKIDHQKQIIQIVKEKGVMDFNLFSLEMYYRNKYPAYTYKRIEPDEEIIDPENFDVITAPEIIWAVFKCKGVTFDEARDETVRKIRNEWIPQTNYVFLWDEMFVHAYSFKDENDFGEIMIAIKEKKK